MPGDAGGRGCRWRSWSLNEEERLRACLESVVWADEIVVVDAGLERQDDGDRPRVHRPGALPRLGRVRRPEELRRSASAAGTGSSRSTPTSACPDALREEIQATLPGATAARRASSCRGRTSSRDAGCATAASTRTGSSGCSGEGAGAFVERAVHESVRVDGPTGRLRAPLIHESYRGVGDAVARAQPVLGPGRGRAGSAGRGGSLRGPPGPPGLAVRWRCTSCGPGFLDGWRGLVLAALHAHYVFLRAAKVRERRSRGGGRRDAGGRGDPRALGVGALPGQGPGRDPGEAPRPARLGAGPRARDRRAGRRRHGRRADRRGGARLRRDSRHDGPRVPERDRPRRPGDARLARGPGREPPGRRADLRGEGAGPAGPGDGGRPRDRDGNARPSRRGRGRAPGPERRQGRPRPVRATPSTSRGRRSRMPARPASSRRSGTSASTCSGTRSCSATRGLAPTPLEQTERLEQLRALEHGVRIRVAAHPARLDRGGHPGRHRPAGGVPREPG